MNKKWIMICLIGLFCFELIFGLTDYIRIFQSKKPNPSKVQVVNPILQVESISEMEEYLDFSIPVLDKEAESYTVLVIDEYPSIGRIYYADGSVFSMQYGTGDISGIYGGNLDRKLSISKTTVSFYIYDDINYALWEKDGYTYSLTGTKDNLESEVTILLS